MNKETIKKAAMERCTTDTMESWKKDFGTSCFMDGANWRINSVWHDAETETPRENEPIIGITGKMLCYMGLCGETAKEICPEMTKWAYVSDLMPEGKEGGQ